MSRQLKESSCFVGYLRDWITLILLFFSGLLPALNLPAHEADSFVLGKQIVLQLPPGPGNPRNSEGDFIQLKDGRVLFVYTHFTGGSGDDAAAHLASRESHDGGRTWSQEDKLVVPNEGRQNVMSVSLLRLRDDRIALFYLRKDSRDDCRPVVRFSSDEARTWGPAHEIADSSGYYVVNNDRVVLLQSGRIVVPVAVHKTQATPWSDGARIFCFLSDDTARTWHRSSFAPNPEHVLLQEPGVVELKDGSLLLFCRTNAGAQYVSVSKDGGEHWTPIRRSNIVSPLSPASIERIPQTGDLLLVWNNNPGDPAGGLRTPFNLAISRDEGKTWEKVKTIESDPKGWYCYTAIEFVGDHVLLGHCAGNRRRESGLARTHITRLSLDWIYADATPDPTVSRDSAGVVELACDLPGARILYTLDGSLPGSDSPVYSGPFRVQHTTPLFMQAFHPARTPSAIVSTTVGGDVLMPALRPACRPEPGLRCFYAEGVYRSVDALPNDTWLRSFVVPQVTLDVRGRDQDFALRFRGFLHVEEPGVYRFALTSNDGSALEIDGVRVLDNDGLHGARRVETRVGLKPGYHRLELRYFQGGRSFELQLKWKPPGGDWEEIPPSNLFHCP